MSGQRTMPRSPGWRVADRVTTAVLVLAIVCWSVLYAIAGPLLLRPVSTCGGPDHRCAGMVDLGVGVGSFGPAIVTVALLVVVAWLGARRRATAPAALIGVVVVVVLQVIGQVLVTNGVVAR